MCYRFALLRFLLPSIIVHCALLRVLNSLTFRFHLPAAISFVSSAFFSSGDFLRLLCSSFLSLPFSSRSYSSPSTFVSSWPANDDPGRHSMTCKMLFLDPLSFRARNASSFPPAVVLKDAFLCRMSRFPIIDIVSLIIDASLSYDGDFFLLSASLLSGERDESSKCIGSKCNL